MSKLSLDSVNYPVDEFCPLIEEDTVSLEQLEVLFALQGDLLQVSALELDAQKALEKICALAEELVPNAIATIMLLDDGGKLNVRSAPSVPEAGIEALNGLVPGPHAGSCGNVVYRKKPTFVANTLEDPRWKDLLGLAKAFNLGACWSMPVMQDNDVTGSFAISSFVERPPTIFHRRILDACANAASIVLRRESAESKIEHIAFHDELTGLRNRAALQRDLLQLIEQRQTAHLFQFGIDRFKLINDFYGHEIGNKLLTTFAHKCQQIFMENGLVYRLGGDEFVFLVVDPIENCAECFCERMSGFLSQPFELGGYSFSITVGVGMSELLGDDNKTDMKLIEEADIAMNEAKRTRANRVVAFEESMGEAFKAASSLEMELKQTVNLIKEQGQTAPFSLHYQPIMKEAGDGVQSLEALIRWHHPEMGMVPPSIFIPVAEDLGLISYITRWVVSQALEDLKKWHKEGLDFFKVSINLSGLEFNKAHILSLIELIKAEELTQFFDFEMTESHLMGHEEEVIELLKHIRSLGIGLSIDDFGTGYSSLTYLKRFPIDKLKIDQSLVRDIVEDSADLAITEAIVAMADAFEIHTVAEGVETNQHTDILNNIGVDFLQGYHYAKPESFDAVSEFLKAEQAK